MSTIRTKSVILLALLWATPASAQTITFSEHISPIVYSHCISCHRSGEIGPMPLTTYEEVAAYADMVGHVTEIRYMPPWKPDPAYSKMVGENILSEHQIQQIRSWVQAGAPRGDPALEASLPTFSNRSALGDPDLVLSMAEPFSIRGDNQDQYQVFVLPTGLLEDRELAAIEFRPGNRQIVHHVLLAVDTTGTARRQDLQISGYGYESFGGFGAPIVDLLPSYTPGAQTVRFPRGVGQKLYKNSDLLIQVHYAPWPVSESDQSTVNIFFKNEPVERRVQILGMVPFSLTGIQELLQTLGVSSLDELAALARSIGFSDPRLAERLTEAQNAATLLGIGNALASLEFKEPFLIPPNQVKRFHGILTINQDISLMSIYPHSHLLGKDWEVFAIDPAGNRINLVRIGDWDFNWQGSYTFETYRKIPASSKIHAYVTYDNTLNNPLNPNVPPRPLSWGEKTTDEMLLLGLFYVPYQTGDERISLATGEEVDLYRSDFNNDSRIDFQDFLLFSRHFGATSKMPDYDAAFDLDKNDRVDFLDFLTFAQDFKKPAG